MVVTAFYLLNFLVFASGNQRYSHNSKNQEYAAVSDLFFEKPDQKGLTLKGDNDAHDTGLTNSVGDHRIGTISPDFNYNYPPHTNGHSDVNSVLPSNEHSVTNSKNYNKYKYRLRDNYKYKTKAYYSTKPIKPTKPVKHPYRQIIPIDVAPIKDEIEVSGSGWNSDSEYIDEASGKHSDYPEEQVKKITNFTGEDDEDLYDALTDTTTGSGIPSETTESSTCNENTCKHGGICGKNDLRCICNVTCSKSNNSASIVCGSDGRIYINHCEMRQRACERQEHITSAPLQLCKVRSDSEEIAECDDKVKNKNYWSSWSIWFQSGNKDFRIRHCLKSTSPESKKRFCSGRLIETRSCKEKRVNFCQGNNGTTIEQKAYQCRGVSLADAAGSDNIYFGATRLDNCWYSLLHLVSNTYRHYRIPYTELLMTSSQDWCTKQKRLLPFTSGAEHCTKLLERFCQIGSKCPYRLYRQTRRTKKNKNNRKVKCEKEFTLSGRLPTGISMSKTKATTLICQKFSSKSKMSQIYGSKDIYYATKYDQRRRIPIYSVTKLENTVDIGWPHVPRYIDTGLISNERFSSFFPVDDAKGLVHELALLKKGTDRCFIGKNQALNFDYQHSGMRPGPLITPDLFGSPAGKVASMALTNSAPMYLSQYYAWINALEKVRLYAEKVCGVSNCGTDKRVACGKRTGDGSRMFIVSGAVPTRDTEEVIGNDVNIPSMFWLAGCCMTEHKNVSSFAMYMRNAPDFPVKMLPVADMEVVLAEMYTPTRPVKVKLFPGYDNACRKIENNSNEYFDI